MTTQGEFEASMKRSQFHRHKHPMKLRVLHTSLVAISHLSQFCVLHPEFFWLGSHSSKLTYISWHRYGKPIGPTIENCYLFSAEKNPYRCPMMSLNLGWYPQSSDDFFIENSSLFCFQGHLKFSPRIHWIFMGGRFQSRSQHGFSQFHGSSSSSHHFQRPIHQEDPTAPLDREQKGGLGPPALATKHLGSRNGEGVRIKDHKQ